MKSLPKNNFSSFIYFIVAVFFIILPFAVYFFINSYFFSGVKVENGVSDIFVVSPNQNSFDFSFRSDSNSITTGEEKTVYLQLDSKSSMEVGVSLVSATVKIPIGVEVVTTTASDGTQVVDKSKTKGLLDGATISLVDYDSAKRDLSFILIADASSGTNFNFTPGKKDFAKITLKTAATSSASYTISFSTDENSVNSVAADGVDGTVIKYLNLSSLSNTIVLQLGSGDTPPPVNNLPTVSITFPTNGETFVSPASVTIKASANDSDGTISKVIFYEILGVSGGNSQENILYTDTTAPYEYTWSNLAPGSYVIRAKAVDNANGMKASSDVTFSVRDGSTPDPNLPYLNITLKLQNRENSARKYSHPNVFVALFDTANNQFSSAISGSNKDGLVYIVDDEKNTAFFAMLRSCLDRTEQTDTCRLIIKPESYLSQVSPMRYIDTDGNRYFYNDLSPFIAGDSIIDTGSFDVVNVRDYVLIKSYYLNDLYQYNTYFFDYNGDGKITVADLGPTRTNYSFEGGIPSMVGSSIISPESLNILVEKMKSAMEFVMYQKIDL